MGGKASLIIVLGFATIFGYINFNMTRLTTTAVENMVGYNEIAMSRNMASAGANIGLAVLTYKQYPHNNRVLSAKRFTSGPFAGCSYVVRIDSLSVPRPHLVLKSASTCTTYLYRNAARTIPYVITDSVIVRFDYDRKYSFASFGWMSQQEGNVFFTAGDTLWGKVHSNDNIHINQNPVFWGKVTTSHNFDPKNNNGVFKAGKQSGVAEIPFPNDLSELQSNATNLVASRTLQLYVELMPGSTSTNDGYAAISTGGFMGAGGTLVQNLALSDVANNVIYSSLDVHVKGILDGRLTIGSGDDVMIEGSTTYESYPDAYHRDPALDDPNAEALLLAQNQTKDMLGLVATDNVEIPSGKGNITIHGSIFAKDGSFTADDWNCGHAEGRINLIGSICQNERGAVGQTNGNGYKKSYRFDPRFEDQFSEDASMHPPAFPSYYQPSNVTIQNWWEKPREPLNVKKYF
jgi:hypothetical protein